MHLVFYTTKQEFNLIFYSTYHVVNFTFIVIWQNNIYLFEFIFEPDRFGRLYCRVRVRVTLTLQPYYTIEGK